MLKGGVKHFHPFKMGGGGGMTSFTLVLRGHTKSCIPKIYHAIKVLNIKVLAI